jgi:hypothetical protein
MKVKWNFTIMLMLGFGPDSTTVDKPTRRHWLLFTVHVRTRLKVSTMEKIKERLFISNFTKIHLMFRVKKWVYGLPEVKWPLPCVIITEKWNYLMICLFYNSQYRISKSRTKGGNNCRYQLRIDWKMKHLEKKIIVAIKDGIDVFLIPA